MQMKWTAVALAALTLVACGKKEEAAAPAATPAATTAAPAPAAPPADALVVKIGHVGPTSGAIAHLGKDNEFGAKMAIEDLNAKGLKIGDKVAKFELLAEDDGADPKQGTAVAQKLVDSKVNGVVGHLNSGTTIPAQTPSAPEVSTASRAQSQRRAQPRHTALTASRSASEVLAIQRSGSLVQSPTIS